MNPNSRAILSFEIRINYTFLVVSTGMIGTASSLQTTSVKKLSTKVKRSSLLINTEELLYVDQFQNLSYHYQ